MKIKRRRTRRLFIGNVPVGGSSPIAVQSMTKTDTRDIRATLRQIRALSNAGCEIVRLAVPDMEAARVLGKIKQASPIPIIADIHFDWRLAVEAVRQGVHGLRINPGNIGAEWKLKEVVSALKDRGIPVRVGVNAGSVPKDLLKKYGHPTADALVSAGERQIAMLNKMGYDTIKVSLKASNVPSTVAAYRAFSKKHDYPLHIGISEAGPLFPGLVKSSVGLGLLLAGGIGDTIRVSLTDSPAHEVRAAYEILKSLGLRKRGPEITSCPTCGRCRVDLRALVKQAEKRLKAIGAPVKVAIMGCAVNGPGEAKEADIGIAAGRGMGVLFKAGKPLRNLRADALLDALMDEIKRTWK